MAIPKTPSQKNQYSKLNKRLATYVSLVHSLYERLNEKAVKIALESGYDGEGEFKFNDDTITKKLIADVQKEFVSEMDAIIYTGTSKEWRESNKIQDLLANKVLSFYEVTNTKGEKYKKYYQTNGDALKAFQDRRNRGMNLSRNLWKQATDYKNALEETISTAIQRGTSAVTLSKKVSQYLLDFDKMRDDYTEKFGKKSKAKDCEYRSIRLARSEINMAYRTAEQTRWRQFDFILGYEIKTSKAHKVKDVCDDLCGKYPKDFKWTGWHPNDMCYAVPIIMSDEEFWGFDEDGNEVETTPRYVEDVPPVFKHWVRENRDKIAYAEKRGTLPYFLRDNKEVYKDVLKAPATISERMAQTAWITDKSADDVFRPLTSQIWKSCTEHEKDALFGYSKTDYYDINGHLRGLVNAPSKEDVIKIITEKIDKSIVPRDVWVRREVDSSNMFGVSQDGEDYLFDALVGKTFQDNAFVSCAIGKEKGAGLSRGIAIEVFVPKGSKGLYLEPFSAYGASDGRKWDGNSMQELFGHEQELLLQRGSRFKVVSWEKVTIARRERNIVKCILIQ